jgi:hypothetical protein
MMMTVLPTPAPPKSPVEHLGLGGLVHEWWRRAVNRQAILGFDRAFAVNRLPQDPEHPAEGLFADRHRDRLAEVGSFHTPHHALSRLHGDAPSTVFTEVLRDLERDIDRHLAPVSVVDDPHGVENLGQVLVGELDIHDWTNDLDNAAGDLLIHRFTAPYPSSACAPETISISSLVMAA